MVNKPVVFISSTSDLRSARDLVGKVLYSMGYEPVWQDIAATEGGELLEILRSRIAPCQVMIQLVGNRYGAEAPYPSPEFGRVSYTQFEAQYAEKLGKKVVYHFLASDFPADTASAESKELVDLQSAYCQRIIAVNKLHQSNITSLQDLELSIRRISDELSAVRKQSDARFQKILFLVGGSLAGLGAVAALLIGGFALLHSRQSEQTAKIDQQTTKVTDQSGQLERIEKLLVAQKQANPQTVPALSAVDQAILDDAKKQGDLKTRATASVLQPDAQTDALLDQLRSQQSAQAFDLDMLEGKRWSFDKLRQYDKAIPCFENAISLRRNSFAALRLAATAHAFVLNGDRAAHRQRAIEIVQMMLELVAPGSADWAATQEQLGLAWSDMPAGNNSENLRKAISAFEAALTVYTRDADPSNWAVTQANLGRAWSKIPSGNRGENLRTAIGYFDAALSVKTKEADPDIWANIQLNLGNAWEDMPTGDKGQNLRRAISAEEACLTVYTREANPLLWSFAKYNLGRDWADMPTGDRAENLHKSISAFEDKLTICTRESDPKGWAYTHVLLGDVWNEMPVGDRVENTRKAISAYQAALTVSTKDFDDAGVWTSALINLSESQILTKDFEQALATTEMGSGLVPPNLALEMNRAHALLLLGRVDEAKALYLKHAGEKIDGRPWEAIIEDDFDQFEKQGMASPQFQVIRDLLKPAK